MKDISILVIFVLTIVLATNGFALPNRGRHHKVKFAVNAVNSKKSVNSIHAKFADTATNARKAENAGVAKMAENAMNAKKAENAGEALLAVNAKYAKFAKFAKYAYIAKNATHVSPTFPSPRLDRIIGSFKDLEALKEDANAESSVKSVYGDKNGGYNELQHFAQKNFDSILQKQYEDDDIQELDKPTGWKVRNAINAERSINSVRAKTAKNAINAFAAKNAGRAKEAKNALYSELAKNAKSSRFAKNALKSKKAKNAEWAMFAMFAEFAKKIKGQTPRPFTTKDKTTTKPATTKKAKPTKKSTTKSTEKTTKGTMDIAKYITFKVLPKI